MRRQDLLAFACALAGACASGNGGENGGEGFTEVTLAVTSPAPGAELLAAEDPAITVAGTIATTSRRGTLEVWVNGASAPVGSDGSFQIEIAAELGINHIRVEGRDGVSEPVEYRLDVLWAPDYLPPLAGTTGFDLADAISLRLGQRFLDTRLLGSDLDLNADPVVGRDLSQVVELVLWHMDLAGLLEEGIKFGEGDTFLDIDIIGTEILDDVIVDVEIIGTPATGLELHIDLLGIFLGMDGEFVFNNDRWVIEGGISADMHASARVHLAVAPGGEVLASVEDVRASVGPLMPGFTGPDGDQLNAFIGFAESEFRLLVEDLIVEELIPTFTDGLPALFRTLLLAIDDLFSDIEFELDTGLGTPVTLFLDGEVAGLDVVPGPAIGANPGHMTVRQDLTIRTSGEPIHPGSRGAVRTDAMPAPPFANAAGIHLAARQDLLNTLLHGLWNAGLLEGEIMVGGLAAAVSARLPPVVRAAPLQSSCRIDGERCDVILQLGQVEIALADFEQSFGVNASAGARIQVVDGEVSLAVQMRPEVLVWETSEEEGVLTPAAVRDLIINLVWPELFGVIGDNLTIPLPLPNLADLGLDAVAPALADAELNLVMRQRLSVTSGYLGLSADIELEAPSP